jgi:hypothetical protein
MTHLAPRTAHSSGRSATFEIVPVRNITAERPDCDPCTWVAIDYRKFRLKFCNTSCPVHATIEKIMTS